MVLLSRFEGARPSRIRVRRSSVSLPVAARVGRRPAARMEWLPTRHSATLVPPGLSVDPREVLLTHRSAHQATRINLTRP